MGRYEHTQFGLMVVILLTAVLVFVIVIAAVVGWHWLMLVEIGLMGSLLAAFHSLTVFVDRECVRVRFGWGPVGKSYPTAEIRDTRTVTNHWYYGWGIRLTPHGWLYNIAGLDAVEIEFASGKKVRIGTDEPRKLQRAVRRAAGLD